MRVAPLARPTLAAVLAVAALVGTPRAAAAFCRTTTCRPDKDPENCKKDINGCSTKGNPLVWPTSCVSFAMDKGLTRFLPPELTVGPLANAFASWQEATCPDGKKPSIAFVTPKEPVSCTEPQANTNGPNVNIVFFRDDFWPYRGIDGTLASTTVTYDTDGTIWDADLAINAASNPLTTSTTNVKYDLESIVLHEVGHFIGLNHSDNGEAVMYASYSPGSVSRKLQADDLKALCTVYPSTRAATCDPKPRGGQATSCEATSPGSSSGCAIAAEPAAAASATGGTSLFALGSVATLGLGMLLRPRRRHRRAAPPSHR